MRALARLDTVIAHSSLHYHLAPEISAHFTGMPNGCIRTSPSGRVRIKIIALSLRRQFRVDTAHYRCHLTVRSRIERIRLYIHKPSARPLSYRFPRAVPVRRISSLSGPFEHIVEINCLRSMIGRICNQYKCPICRSPRAFRQYIAVKLDFTPGRRMAVCPCESIK